MKILLGFIFVLINTIASFSTSAAAESVDSNSAKKRPVVIEDLAQLSPTEQAHTLIDLSEEQRQTDYRQSLAYAKQAIAILEDLSDTKSLLKALQLAAINHAQLGEHEQATAMVEKGLKLTAEAIDPLLRAEALKMQTSIAIHTQDFYQARYSGEALLAIRQQHGPEEEMAETLLDLGIVEDYSARYSRALQYYFEALTYAEKYQARDTEARLLNNIGIVKRLTEDFEGAIEYFNKAISLKRQIALESLGIGASYNSLILTLNQVKQYEEAIKQADIALAHIGERHAPNLQVRIMAGKGQALRELGRLEASIALLEKAEQMAVDSNLHSGKLMVFRYLAASLLAAGELDRALEYAMKNHVEGRVVNPSAHMLLSDIYLAKKDYQKAYDYLLIERKLQIDGLRDVNKKMHMELEEQYNNVKLKKNIASLEIINTQQQQQRNWIIATSLIIIALVLLLYRMRTYHLKTTVLEQRIKERTAELEENQAAIAKLLDKKNDLFANVSHEFRTPLTLILGPVQTLLNDKLAPALKDKLESIRWNANRLLLLVDQLLTFARIDAKVKTSHETLDVRRLASRIVSIMSPLADDKNLSFNHDLEDKLYIHGDAEALETILINLLSNAIKFTPASGSIKLTGKIEGKSVVLIVSDTGIGIPPEQQGQVFERFVRLNSESETVQGSGIGLALVKELTEQLQGTVQLSNVEPHGCEFTLRFPLVPATSSTTSAVAQKPSESFETQVAQLTSQLHKSQVVQISPTHQEQSNSNQLIDVEAEPDNRALVLVIEDDLELRAYLKEILAPQYEVLEAADGQEGITLAKEKLPDLVISDVMMPKQDGFQVARAIREDELSSHIPILLLTAKFDPDSRLAGWRENVDDYLAKPFNPDELLIRVQSILNVRSILQKRFSKFKVGEINQHGDYLFLERLNTVIEANFHDAAFDVDTLTEHLNVGRSQLYRKLRAVLDYTPRDYLREFRLERAKALLETQERVGKVADLCGFKSSAYFSSCFKAQFDLSPKEYQKQHAA